MANFDWSRYKRQDFKAQQQLIELIELLEDKLDKLLEMMFQGRLILDRLECTIGGKRYNP